MIPQSILGRIAHSAGIEDRWLVTLDVVALCIRWAEHSRRSLEGKTGRRESAFRRYPSS